MFEASKLILGISQVRTVVFGLVEIVAEGGVLFDEITALDVAIQPFAAVTVTVKAPAVVIEFDAATVEPSLQRYVPPPLAVNIVLGVAQVKAKLPVMPTTGGALFKVVTALDVAVQPFAPVTVTVNVPAVVIEFDAATVEPLLQI